MWCSTCQQDVPGLGSPSSGGELRCGKCGAFMEAANQANIAAGDSTEPGSVAAACQADKVSLEKLLRSAPLGEEDWALEAELRGVQRLLGSLKSRAPNSSALVSLHARHNSLAACHANSSEQLPETDVSSPAQSVAMQPRGHAAAWVILSLGLAVFACGAVLLGWSLVGQREDLWPVGMPLALIGQAGLVLGLILQLDGLWSSSRKTEQALSELDGELRTVRQATTLLSTSYSGGAQSFYLHLAEGASPQLLLADLKGQMDLLARQMSRQAK
jgi:hypothetical protein